jgi:hypothetical protein
MLILEQLEDRALLSTINWVNRGMASDNFDSTFGANAAAARAVVDAALDDWEQVIPDFQQAVLQIIPIFPFFEIVNPNTLDITLSMNATGTGFGGGAGAPASYDLNGHPLTRSINISRGNDTSNPPDGIGDGAGWYLDPNPNDHGEFAGPIVNAFVGQATPGGPAAGLTDLYSLVTIEMDHALGITNFEDSGSPRWRTNNPFITDTGVADTIDTNGNLFTFVSPNVSALLTANNGGPGGTDTGRPLHVARPQNGNPVPGFTGALDVGNAFFFGSQRYLPSLLSSLMLQDVYGYTLATGGADVFGTMHALLNAATGNVLVRGMTGNNTSNDIINISRDGGQLVVSVDVGADVAGTGPTTPLESRFAIGSVSSITINGLDGTDTINLSGDLSFLSGAIIVTGDGGGDTLTVNFAVGNPVPASGLSFDGGTSDAGEDLLVLQNGTFATETYPSTGPSSGTIALSGGTNITYTNLSPIDDTLVVTDMFFNADLATGDDVAIENSPLAGRSRIRSSNSTFELVDYANKTNLIVNGRGGGDTFNLTATLVAPGPTSLTINGGIGSDNFNVSTTIVATTINGDDATDTMNIRATASALVVNGGNDDDTINIGSLGDSLDDIQGTVAVNGNSATAGDTLNLNDHGDIDPHTYTVNATTLSRNGAALVTYGTVEDVVINGGSGGNTVNVRGTPSGTRVTVNSGAGGDTISVGNVANSLDDIQGDVTVNGQAPPSAEPLTINDQGDLDAHTYSISATTVTRSGAASIVYATVESLTLNAGLADDTIDVLNTATPANVVNAGNGDDTINVRGTAAGAPLTVNGGNDDDTINIGSLGNSLDDIQGAVTVNGNAPAASDALNVNDQGDADANDYVITSSTVNRAGAAQIAYGTVESLTVNGGRGGNTINVQSTLATTPVVVNAGAGDDDIRVDSNGGPLDPPDGTVDLVVSSLTINGQGGTNALLLEDYSDPGLGSGDVVHVTPTQIGADAGDSFFGAGGSLTYSGLDHVTLDLSNGYFPDTVYLIPSPTTEFELHGNDPHCPMNPDQLPGDALYVDFTGVTDPALVSDGEGNSVWTFGNREDVAFDGFEKLNHVGIIVVAPDEGSAPLVRVFNAETGVEKFSFFAFDPSFKGGVRVAVGDTNCDGIPDIIVGAGPGAPEVRVFNGVTAEPQSAGVLGSFFAYDTGSKAGVWVAAGDVNQDGFTDIITGPDNGGGAPLVKVFSGEDGSLHAEFLAYGEKFQGRVRVAVGDMNGDVFPDVITVPGPGHAPELRVFDGTDLAGPAIESFLAFDNSYRRGLYLAVGDLTGDGRADIVASGGAGGTRLVRVFDGTDVTAPPVASFQPYQTQSGDSIRVALVDINEDGDLELVTAPGPGGQDDPKVFDFDAALNPDEVDAYFDALFDSTGGYFVAGGG